MTTKDIEKQRLYRRAWYSRNAKHAKQKVIERRHAMADWIRSYKESLACLMCGEAHVSCLDFHHRDKNDKDFAVSTLAAKGWSKERILTEITKCDVLCSNCHRKLHWLETHKDQN